MPIASLGGRYYVTASPSTHGAPVRINDNISNETQALYDRWFIDGLAPVYREQGRRASTWMPAVLMACTLYGEAYLQRFERWCLPSLLGRENLNALFERSIIVLFTDAASYLALVSMIRPLRARGLDVRLVEMPPYIEADLGQPNGKYRALGTAQNIGLQMAARWGVGFHMLQPDHVYPPKYFHNLSRLANDHPAIVQTGLSAHLGRAFHDIERYRQADDTLVIPSDELGAIGFRHMHQQMRCLTMTEPGVDLENMPIGSWVGWAGRDAYTIHSPHANIVWLSPELTQRAPSSVPENIDTQAPWLMPDGAYVVTPEDEMGFIELSADEKAHCAIRQPWQSYATAVWDGIKFHDEYLPFLRATCRVAIGERNEGWTNAAIDAQATDLIERTVAFKPVAMQEWIERARAA